MAVRVFQQSSTQDLSALYDFLMKYKEGTFLENTEITLTNSDSNIENGKIVFNDGNSELFIQNAATNSSVQLINCTGEYISNAMVNYNPNGSKYQTTINSALFCSKGLIFSITSGTGSTAKQITRLIVTVDNADRLATIIPNKDAYAFSASDIDYYISTYDSTDITAVKTSPTYGMNKTSLSPVALKAVSADRYLPYAYAALTTQLAAEGLQTVLIDGAPFITNGIWYIKDPE